MSADSLSTFIYIKGNQSYCITIQDSYRAYQHEDRSIFALSAPVLRWMSRVVSPVGLFIPSVSDLSRKFLSRLTLIPHLKGVIAVPTTGSWLIAMISLFFRIKRVSLVIEASYKTNVLSPTFSFSD